MKKNILILLSVLLSTSIHAKAKQNDCQMFDSVVAAANEKSIFEATKSEARFNEIITQVTDLYSEDFNRMGVKLTITRDWKDSTLNAFAQKIDSKNWNLHFFGGLYKNSNVTDDAFALVVCHETGHLLGGAPFYNNSSTSSEGQADFWATSVCMKKYSALYKKSAAMDNLNIKNKCDKHFENNSEDQNTCYRTAQAGASLATFFARADLKTKPEFDKSNPTKLAFTFDLHPEAQCRLDTYMAGALCDREDVSSEKLLTERLTTDSLCNEVIDGAAAKTEKRPGCWFNEKIHVFKNLSDDKLKSHSVFGLKDGMIQLSFNPHAMGLYKVKLEVDNKDGSAEFVELKEHEFIYYKYPYALTGDFPFTFKFTKKANRKINFKLTIYKDDALYMEDVIVIKAFALL
jgi:hypothetical protein